MKVRPRTELIFVSVFNIRYLIDLCDARWRHFLSAVRVLLWRGRRPRGEGWRTKVTGVYYEFEAHALSSSQNIGTACRPATARRATVVSIAITIRPSPGQPGSKRCVSAVPLMRYAKFRYQVVRFSEHEPAVHGVTPRLKCNNALPITDAVAPGISAIIARRLTYTSPPHMW